jgi:hypothetical protein
MQYEDGSFWLSQQRIGECNNKSVILEVKVTVRKFQGTAILSLLAWSLSVKARNSMLGA